jgi:hypothetical protein
MRLPRALARASVTLLFLACSANSSPTVTPPPSPVVPPESAAAVDAARQAAAAHLGVGADQLQASRVEAQQWPDASLGCPQPGQLYSQIVTPGFLVIVTSGSHQLEYHTDARGRVVLCRET